jgi:energy-coupling factor transporter ATP-binding protein EcfA2
LLGIRVQGLRTLGDVQLQLGGLTVLIGDNGTGKSTLLEALSLLSGLAGPEPVGQSHALDSAIRQDVGGYILSSIVEIDGVDYVHVMAIRRGGGVAQESLRDRANDASLFFRIGPNLDSEKSAKGIKSRHFDPRLSMLQLLAPAECEVAAEIRELYRGIDTHLPFEVTASWGKRTRGTSEKSHMREPRLAESGHRLATFGDNLVNAYQTLRNDKPSAHWRETLELIRLGLGSDIADVSVSAAGGGYLTLAVEFHSVGKIPALQLADGLLTYLAFVALVRLDDGRSLLAFDEPETHLHPGLLARVMTLLEDAATRYPVVLSTHSDRLLDCLSDPVGSVVVCELDDKHTTRLRRLDAAQFDKWREHFNGVGDIRAENQLESILAEPILAEPSK